MMKNENKIDPKKLVDVEQYAEQEACRTHSLDRRSSEALAVDNLLDNLALQSVSHF